MGNSLSKMELQLPTIFSYFSLQSSSENRATCFPKRALKKTFNLATNFWFLLLCFVIGFCFYFSTVCFRFCPQFQVSIPSTQSPHSVVRVVRQLLGWPFVGTSPIMRFLVAARQLCVSHLTVNSPQFGFRFAVSCCCQIRFIVYCLRRVGWSGLTQVFCILLRSKIILDCEYIWRERIR